MHLAGKNMRGHSGTSPALSQRARNKLVACHWRHLRIIGLSPHSLMGSTKIDHPQGTWNLIIVFHSAGGDKNILPRTNILYNSTNCFWVYTESLAGSCEVFIESRNSARSTDVDIFLIPFFPLLLLVLGFICTASLTCEKTQLTKKINSLNINII